VCLFVNFYEPRKNHDEFGTRSGVSSFSENFVSAIAIFVRALYVRTYGIPTTILCSRCSRPPPPPLTNGDVFPTRFTRARVTTIRYVWPYTREEEKYIRALVTNTKKQKTKYAARPETINMSSALRRREGDRDNYTRRYLIKTTSSIIAAGLSQR